MKAKLVAVAATGVMSALLLSVSSPSCGCETPVMQLGWELEMFAPPAYALPQDMTTHAIKAAACKKFRGASLANLSPPSSMRDEDCKRTASNRLECTYWLEVGPLREEGKRVEFFAGTAGDVERVEVTNVRRWLKSYESDL